MEATEPSEREHFQTNPYPDGDPEQVETTGSTVCRRTSPLKKTPSGKTDSLHSPTRQTPKGYTSSLRSCCGFLQESHLRSLPAYTKICNHPSVKDAVIAVLVVIVIVLSFVIVFVSQKAEKPKQGSHDLAPLTHCGPPCPPHWIGYEGSCYYFSKEKRNWTASQNLCFSYNASLARIEGEEKTLVMFLRDEDSYWIGLRRSPGQPWKWPNGEKSVLNVHGEGGYCVYLDNKAIACSSGCHAELPCICSKPAACASPNRSACL